MWLDFLVFLVIGYNKMMNKNVFEELKGSLLSLRADLIDKIEKEKEQINERFSEDKIRELAESIERIKNVNSRRNPTSNK